MTTQATRTKTSTAYTFSIPTEKTFDFLNATWGDDVQNWEAACERIPDNVADMVKAMCEITGDDYMTAMKELRSIVRRIARHLAK